MKQRKSRPPQMDRRLLLGVIVVLGIILAIRVTDRPLNRYVILPLANYPPGSVSLYVPNQRGYSPFFVVHADEGEVYAIVAQDPHTGCRVVWNSEGATFTDTCDGYRYSVRGESLTAGSDLPLARYYVEFLADDGLLVDLDIIAPPGTVAH